MLIPVNDLEEFHEKVLQVFEKALRLIAVLDLRENSLHNFTN